jgi:hypothetical protein
MKLNNQSVVEHPETGEVITLFTKLDKEGNEQTYGRVQIQSVALTLNNGFVSQKKRTAFVTLDSPALQLIGSKIKAGMPYPMEGKITILETLEPQWLDHKPKINPTTGETIEINGHLIYRSTEFTSNMDAQDVIVNPYSVKEPEETVHAEEQLIEESEVI